MFNKLQGISNEDNISNDTNSNDSTSIITGDSLFTSDELNMLNQLTVADDDEKDIDETLVEFKNGQYFLSSLSNDDAFDPNANNLNVALNTNEVNEHWKLCPHCKVRLQDLGVASSECSKCGAEINKNSEDHEIKKGSSFSGATQANYINCDSKAYVRCKIVKELKQKNYDSTKHKIPMFIIEAAVDQFLTISEHKIHRGSIQRGLKGMLIKYKLDESNMSKSTKVIGQIYGLTDKQLSTADALLRAYDAEGIIKISCLNVDRTLSFISNHINIFKVEAKYINFINELINEADRKKVHLHNNFKPSTKAAGAFILFLNSFPALTSSTVNRYYNLLMDNLQLLSSVYNRWGIKQPPKENKIKSQKSSLPPMPVIIKLEPLSVNSSGVLQDG